MVELGFCQGVVKPATEAFGETHSPREPNEDRSKAHIYKKINMTSELKQIGMHINPGPLRASTVSKNKQGKRRSQLRDANKQ